MDARTEGGKVSAVHELDVGEFVARTDQQGLRLVTTCHVCRAAVAANDAGAFKRLGAALLMCCDNPSCLAGFVE